MFRGCTRRYTVYLLFRNKSEQNGTAVYNIVDVCRRCARAVTPSRRHRAHDYLLVVRYRFRWNNDDDDEIVTIMSGAFFLSFRRRLLCAELPDATATTVASISNAVVNQTDALINNARARMFSTSVRSGISCTAYVWRIPPSPRAPVTRLTSLPSGSCKTPRARAPHGRRTAEVTVAREAPRPL
jgi:hypothetical protein